ncbi:MAG: Lipid-A-disaccharide synthase [Myxococcaceae bacterium]|nr:Lipid-A-disaccharide synthase [Myxococcaceae bacterium]MEA2745910.1 lipid-A-disaccharide synthase [Myxococcales bacterium]
MSGFGISAAGVNGGDLLVVAGEASGDRAGAAVISHLPPGIRAFGMGGGALASEGVELVADLRDTTALGVAEVARRAFGVARAYALVRTATALRKPAAALLVNYTEFNARLAHALWQTGTRVLWYGAPQVWAWRSGRAIPLRRHLDRMAVMLPFEEPLWRSFGVDAHYVGHPALEERRASYDRVSARETLGMTPRAWGVAILPGSRPHEVRRLLPAMLEGYERVRLEHASVDARVLLAPSLDANTRAWARATASAADVELVDVDARSGMGYALPAFDAALCASGTASLECVLARAVPIVCYRVGWATELGVRAFVKTQHVALPNILLGRGAFPELLQRHATASRMTEALTTVLEARESFLGACTEVEATLGDRREASRTVARMLEPWLATRAA